MSTFTKASVRAIKTLLMAACADLSRVEDGENVNLDQALADAAMATNKICLLRMELQRIIEDDAK